MKKSKRPAKIVTGHSLSEYFKRFGRGYANLKLESTKDKDKLKPGKKYWKIDDTYYQVNHARALKITVISVAAVSLAANIALPVYFCCFANREKYVDYNFKYWNDNTSLNTLKDYVKDTVNPSSKNYIPKVDRIATFDMDGTLFGERAPIYIEWIMFDDYLNNKKPELLDTNVENIYYPKTKTTKTKTFRTIDTEVKDFMTGTKNEELEMDEAYAGAKLFSGLTIPQYINYVDSFLNRSVTDYFNNLKFKDMFYKPMIEVVEFLQVNNFDVYIVSGTDRFMVRDIVNKHLTIPSNKVIGMDVNLEVDEHGTITRGEKLMYKNVEKVKVELITQEIGKKPVLSFGNSTGDVEMHDLCLSNEKYKTAAFMVNNDDNARERADDRSGTWKNYPRYNVFSMRDHWKTIYGDNVTKK